MATKKYRNRKLISSIYDIEPHYFAGLGDESQQLTIRPRGAQNIYSWDTTTVGEGTPYVLGDSNNQLGRITMDPKQTNNSNLNIAGYDKLGRTIEGKEEPGYMDKYGLNWMSIGAGAANAGMQMYANLTEDDDVYDSGDINARGWKLSSNLLGLGNSAYNLARPDASPEIQNQIKSNNAILDEAAKDIGQTIKINAMDDASNLDLFHSHVADDINTDYDLSRDAGETIAGIGSSMLEGAKSGSIGGPWGALGGAVTGLGAGLIGAFNGASHRKAEERMRRIKNEQIARANEIDFRNRQTASKAITDFNINNYRIQSMTNPDIILQGANYAALGGPLFTNGGIFDNGIDYIGTGGTHGQNKLGGVPMGIANDGQPNLVEEGEAIWHNGNDDYVFSNRIKIPKKLRTKYRFKDNVSTFADAVNYIQKASEERPNDPIEQRTIDNILKEFQTEQEIIRQRQAQREQEKMMRAYAQYPEMMQQMQMQQDPNAMQQMPPEMIMQQQMPQEVPPEEMPMVGAYGGPLFAGGGILIKPSKRGTFTAAATKHGMGVQEFANKVLANPENYSPAMRKKANFARNASHWHGLGGYIFDEGGPIEEPEMYIDNPPKGSYEWAFPEEEVIPGDTYYMNNDDKRISQQVVSEPVVKNTTYKIKRGDTLSGIAKIYGVNYMDIARANNIADPNKIIVGREIIIPNGKAISITKSSTSKNNKKTTPSKRQSNDNFDIRTDSEDEIRERFSQLPQSTLDSIHAIATVNKPSKGLSNIYGKANYSPMDRSNTFSSERDFEDYVKYRYKDALNAMQTLYPEYYVNFRTNYRNYTKNDVDKFVKNFTKSSKYRDYVYAKTYGASPNFNSIYNIGIQPAGPEIGVTHYGNPLHVAVTPNKVPYEFAQGGHLFAGHTFPKGGPYTIGDKTYYIDWNNYANLDKLLSLTQHKRDNTLNYLGNDFNLDGETYRSTIAGYDPVTQYISELLGKQEALPTEVRTFLDKQRELSGGKALYDPKTGIPIKNASSLYNTYRGGVVGGYHLNPVVTEGDENAVVTDDGNNGRLRRYWIIDSKGNKIPITEDIYNKGLEGYTRWDGHETGIDESGVDGDDYYLDWNGQPEEEKIPQYTYKGKPYKYKPDWRANFRYMPLYGLMANVFTDLAGLTNVPDYTYENELEQAAKRRPTLIGYKPIGDYMMHTPEDRNYMANQIAQQQNAGRRALIDNANGNIGATQMGLLGNSFNTGITLGDLYDKTQRASVDDRKIVNDFNRGTNQFNATAYNRAQEFNAGLMDNYLNRQYDAKAKSLAMKQAEDARVDAARQANLTTLFNNIGDIGWEAYNRNMINSNNALYFGTGRLGNSFYKNQWDDMTDEQRALAIQQMYPWISNPPQVRTGRPASGQSTTGKNGGYITIKNKRRK